MEFQFSVGELDSFAKNFWQVVDGTKVFAFHGEMGAGKTTIISALAEAKGTKDLPSSPTFSIINEYEYVENGAAQKMYHIDLYRLKDEEEVMNAGVEDCVYSGALCLVEWPEKAPYLFEEGCMHVYIDILSEDQRRVRILQ